MYKNSIKLAIILNAKTLTIVTTVKLFYVGTYKPKVSLVESTKSQRVATIWY